jgi:hypothetical protein
MKPRYTSATTLFLIFVLVCIASIGTAATQRGGRLIQIDGRTVSNVVQGRRYDHFVPAGRHVLMVAAVPNYSAYQPTSTVLNVRPGQTYVFTAVWRDTDTVVLVPSALPPGQPY